MRHLLAFFVVAIAVQGFGAQQPASIRTIKNLPAFPLQSLRAGVGRTLYRSLAVSPIAAWLVARTALAGGRSGNAKIIHSEGNGVYDKMLLEMANGYSVSGQNTTDTRLANDTLNVHLLVYEVKNGKMAVCFSHSDDARYVGYKQSGIAWVGVQQGGKWVTISGKDERKWGGRPW
jgi:hypothetical protein